MKDKREWLTIFPDYPRVFAWINDAMPDDALRYVGDCFGEIDLQGRVDIGGEPVEPELAEKIRHWMKHWWAVDGMQLSYSCGIEDDERRLEAEEDAVNAEGLEIARLIKAAYGDRYRVRYSYAWQSGFKKGVVV